MAGRSEGDMIRIFFLPLMSPGHMIPMVDMAKLIALRADDNISVTIITTPANEPLIRPSISSLPIELLLVPFPSSVSHLLRDGKENLSSLTVADFPNFFQAFLALQHPIQDLLFARKPHCLVSDYLYHWTTNTAITLNIPIIVFYGHGAFASCVHDALEKVSDQITEDPPFVIEGTGFPHRIEIRRSEVSIGVLYSGPEILEMRASVDKSYGVVVNTFYDLEPQYAQLYRDGGRRAYYVGPVSLQSEEERGAGQQQQVMAWLDSKEESSVLYVCFGSLNEFCSNQIKEIAVGLEQSGWPFVWAMRGDREGLPDGYEERVKGRGVVIRGWAPQRKILNHAGVGGFVTHCGWNSVLESVSAGVPMTTWPVEYEQFVNEKLIVQVLDIGVSVGRCAGEDGEKGLVKAEEIAEAAKNVMGDVERRARVREYAALAKAAMEEGGSSYNDMTRLIQDIKEYSAGKAS